MLLGTGAPTPPSSRPQPPTGPGQRLQKESPGRLPPAWLQLTAQQNAQSWRMGLPSGFAFCRHRGCAVPALGAQALLEA